MRGRAQEHIYLRAQYIQEELAKEAAEAAAHKLVGRGVPTAAEHDAGGHFFLVKKLVQYLIENRTTIQS
jgi:hypothetical protein